MAWGIGPDLMLFQVKRAKRPASYSTFLIVSILSRNVKKRWSESRYIYTFIQIQKKFIHLKM